MENRFKTITAAEFAALDRSKYTLIDLRDPEDLIVSGIEGAINIPYEQFAGAIDTVPADKPVIVFCYTGESSEEIAELLAARGYDVAHVAGGYGAYRRVAETGGTETPGTAERVFIDARGLKCPGPIVKVAEQQSMWKQRRTHSIPTFRSGANVRETGWMRSRSMTG